MNIFKTKYRIVADDDLGWEVQYRKWFWPFYFQVGFVNTFKSLKEAKDFAIRHANKIYVDTDINNKK